MLVNIHKHIFIVLILLTGLQEIQAQEKTLQQCIDIAQKNNKNLQIVRNNLELSELKQKEAKSSLIPKITANGEYKYFTDLPYQLLPLSVFGGPDGQFKEAQFGVPHNISANLQLAVPLYNPQINNAIQNTKLATEIAEIQQEKSSEQIYFEISNLYYNAQILHHSMSFVDSNIYNANELLQTMQLLNEHLLAKTSDVNQVKLQVTQLLTKKEMLNVQYNKVINALKFTMGLATDETLTIYTDIQYSQSSNYTNNGNYDEQMVRKTGLILVSQQKGLKLSRIPSISLFGSYGTTGYGYDETPNDFLNFYPIGFAGVKLNFPLFNGGLTKQKINQKEIEISNNTLLTELLVDQNKMQIGNSTLQRNFARTSVETSLQQIELAQTIYDQKILQQKEGLANLSDVLLADNALRDVQQSYLSAVIDFLKADLDLKRLTGNILK